MQGFHMAVLGGSWVVISRVIISRVTILITHIRGLINPLITTHEPPSMAYQYFLQLLCKSPVEACRFK